MPPRRRPPPPDSLSPAARRELAVAHLGWARRLAGPFEARWPRQADDIRSAAYLGLWEAALAFDPGRGLTFTTASRHRIVGAVQDYLKRLPPLGYRGKLRRDRGGIPAVVSLDRSRAIHAAGITWDGDSRGGATLAETVAAGDEPVGRGAEWEDDVHGMARRLPQREAEVVTLLYTRADTGTLRAAGRALGVSESLVCHIHQAAIDHLRATVAGAASGRGNYRRGR